MNPDPTAPRTTAEERENYLRNTEGDLGVSDPDVFFVRRLIAHVEALTTRERALVAALRIAHLIPSQHGMPDTSVEEYAATGCHLCALLAGQSVAQDEGRIAIAERRLGLEILEKEGLRDEVARLREHFEKRCRADHADNASMEQWGHHGRWEDCETAMCIADRATLSG